MTLPIGKVLVGMLRCPRLTVEHATVIHQHTSQAVETIRAEGKYDIDQYYALLKGGHCRTDGESTLHQAMQWQSTSIWNHPIDKKEVALLILVVDPTFTKLLESRILSFVTQGKAKARTDWWRTAINRGVTARAGNYVKKWTVDTPPKPLEVERMKACTSYLSQDDLITEFSEKIFKAAQSGGVTWGLNTSNSIF